MTKVMGKNSKDLVTRGKQLAFLLRHDTEYKFDRKGWREVSDLVKNHGYTLAELEEIVETNDKKRYEFDETKKRIRARQGHSISVDVELEEVTPPDVLYHGTATRFLSSIYDKGILKGTRLHVHLSDNAETALKTGSRHGKPVALIVDAKQMHDDGLKFYRSANGVYLTDYVARKYLIPDITQHKY